MAPAGRTLDPATALTEQGAEASYWTLRWGTVARTVEVSTDVHVDVDEQGVILGVERIGGVVDMSTLADVLRMVRL